MTRYVKLALIGIVLVVGSFVFMGRNGLVDGLFPARTVEDQNAFLTRALNATNEGSGIEKLDPLRSNPLMQDWLSRRARTAAKTGGGALSEMLMRLRESHPHIGSSSVHVVYGNNVEALLAELAQEWEKPMDEFPRSGCTFACSPERPRW